MGLFGGHTVKAAGKDSVDSRSGGRNKIAKFDRQLARNAGKAMRSDERVRWGQSRRP